MLQVKLGTFETLGLAILAIWVGNYLRKLVPAFKKYCLPGAVVGGTLFSIITWALYKMGIVEPSFNYAAVNSLFYCIFFAASGAAAGMALLRKGGKLVVIFAFLAAVLAAFQNVISIGLGKVLGVPPLIALMTGSIPLTGGHGNAASFAPMAVEAGAAGALEVALAAATFGLISGCIIGGPFGNFIIKRHHLEDPTLDGSGDMSGAEGVASVAMKKSHVVNAMLLMCFACGLGQLFLIILKKLGVTFPIHVCCMLSGIIFRFILDKKGDTEEAVYEAIDTVGEFSLQIFVAMSIASMKLWQLEGLGLKLFILAMAQVVFIIPFCYFLTFNLCGRDYDAAVMAVGHTGFGLGAVPVSMATMGTVCGKYRMSKLAYFVVPVVGGFLSNITNAIIITKFIDIAAKM